MKTEKRQSKERLPRGAGPGAPDARSILSPDQRPGVPREQPAAAGAQEIEPEQQPVTGDVLVRAELRRPTPVFSTALPPRGLSGALRRVAYRIPDHRVTHWILLMVADRVDVVESRLLSVMLPPGRPAR
jgi:hypothetical protein